FGSITLVNSCLTSLLLSNVSTPTVIYILSLHDALPISQIVFPRLLCDVQPGEQKFRLPAVFLHHPGRSQNQPLCSGKRQESVKLDRKSTRLNSSHVSISYAVFCLKKKKEKM